MKYALQSWIEFKIGIAAVNGDCKFRQFDSPFASQQLKNVVRTRIESQSDVLRFVRVRTSQEVDGAKGVGRADDCVVSMGPDLAHLADAFDAVSLVVGPCLAASALRPFAGIVNIVSAFSFKKCRFHPSWMSRPDGGKDATRYRRKR